MAGTVAIIAGILVAVLVPLIGFVHKRERKLRGYYEVRWKKSSSLRPEEIMGPRGLRGRHFHNYYYPRDVDELVKQKILRGENVLLVGRPLSGKTRAIYEALRALGPAHDVLVPQVREVESEDFLIPRHLQFWRKEIVVLDDLDKFLEQDSFTYLVHKFFARGTIIVASCRSGYEYDRVQSMMERELALIFATPIEVTRVSRRQAEQVARDTDRRVPDRFDGNIGSLFLELDTMREVQRVQRPRSGRVAGDNTPLPRGDL